MMLVDALAVSLAETAGDWRRRSQSLPDNVVYVPDQYWQAFGAARVSASASAMGLAAKRPPPLPISDPDGLAPNRADRRAATRRGRRR